MDVQNTEKLDALKKDVVELVTEHWQAHGKAYLLAGLGKALIARGFDLQATLAGRKLRAYISTELKDRLKVLSPRSNPLKVGAVPAGADLSGGVDILFTSPSKPAESDGHVPSFVPAFWAAFTRPIPTGRIRTLSLAPKIQFQEVSEAAANSSGKKTVSPEFVVSPGSLSNGEYRTAVYSNIRRWLTDNDIELTAVLAGSSAAGSMAAEGRVASGSLLEQMMAVLTDEELRRVSLPLDIVARLAKA
ncbi:hypothetical protein PQR70_26070 [Paraburkholderia madseniana]|uniref:hypothetical protein n=1 Tax=Paraburkholderia madseniana TaxID=2599607 RepID=UPI0038BA80BF